MLTLIILAIIKDPKPKGYPDTVSVPVLSSNKLPDGSIALVVNIEGQDFILHEGNLLPIKPKPLEITYE